jgi:hypothetical protein
MKDAPNHRVPQAVADAFVASQKQGTLAAYAEGGFPRLSLLPFVKDGDLIEMHCVQLDPTFQALCRNPRVTFMVSDYLGTYPSEWVDPNDGGRGSTIFRAVSFDCLAEHDTDPAAVAAGLTKLLSVYEPGARHGTITDGEVYGARLRQLAFVRLRIVAMQAKFKIGPPGPGEKSRRANVAAQLRKRGQLGDLEAAHWIDHYNELRRDDGSWSV